MAITNLKAIREAFGPSMTLSAMKTEWIAQNTPEDRKLSELDRLQISEAVADGTLTYEVTPEQLAALNARPTAYWQDLVDRASAFARGDAVEDAA